MTEIINSDDEEYNQKSHKKLLDGIGRITKFQHIKQPTRTETVLNKSEFDLIKPKGGDEYHHSQQKNDLVTLPDLVRTLKKTGNLIEIGKELSKAQKTRKTLAKPLEKPVQDRIERSIGYDKVKKDLGRWDAVVTQNRALDQLEFPLNGEKVKVYNEKPREAFSFAIKPDWMKELEALTPMEKSEDVKDSNEFPLTLDELREKRREMARLRIKESYKIAKAARMSKIKSKKYHRMLKRDKIRQQMKEFEILKKSDPEAALKQLELIEKSRVEERANLRHKNTGTWAKNLQVRAKYDKDVRAELAQQLAISRELTQKQKIEESSSDDDNDEMNGNGDDRVDPMNPWTSKKGEVDEVGEFVSGYRKYWKDRNENEKQLQEFKNGVDLIEKTEIDDGTIESPEEKIESDEDEEVENSILSRSGIWLVESVNSDLSAEDTESSDDDEPEIDYEAMRLKRKSGKSLDEMFDDVENQVERRVEEKLKKLREGLEAENQSSNHDRSANKRFKGRENGQNMSGLEFKNQKQKADIDVEFNETETNDRSTYIEQLKKTAASTTEKTHEEIDPNNFITIKPKHLNIEIPSTVEMTEAIDDDEDDDNRKQITLAEAFEEDDIVADFERDKDEERKKNQIDDVDTTLPGWGQWAGTGIVKRPNKRFITKMPKAEPRRDDKKSNLILNETTTDQLRKHLVSDLPFPFTSVKDYEASVRAPIGSTFVPETAHKVLTRPAVKTKMGTIIEAMDDSSLVDKKSTGRKEKRSKKFKK